MITVKVSELLKMAESLSADGMKYVNISECPSDDDLPKCLSFKALSNDLDSEVDYEEIEEAKI